MRQGERIRGGAGGGEVGEGADMGVYVPSWEICSMLMRY